MPSVDELPIRLDAQEPRYNIKSSIVAALIFVSAIIIAWNFLDQKLGAKIGAFAIPALIYGLFYFRDIDIDSIVLDHDGLLVAFRSIGNILIPWSSIEHAEITPGAGFPLRMTVYLRFRSGFDFTVAGRQLGWWYARIGINLPQTEMSAKDLAALLNRCRLGTGAR